MLEEQIEGVDVRVFVVGRRAVAAATRLPAYLVGDGRMTVADLTQRKRRWRSKNAFLAEFPMLVDQASLARAGWQPGAVPDAGQVVLLNETANVATGGENIDVTDLLHPRLATLAVEATRAIPGLGLAGVDLMTPHVGRTEGGTILEVNWSPGFGLHHYPAYGSPRDVVGPVVDEMIATSPSRVPTGTTAPTRAAGRTSLLAEASRLSWACRRTVLPSRPLDDDGTHKPDHQVPDADCTCQVRAANRTTSSILCENLRPAVPRML
ncbi:MAG: hypothetical protein ACR2FE_08725 [Aeromicrobium sp.]